MLACCPDASAQTSPQATPEVRLEPEFSADAFAKRFFQLPPADVLGGGKARGVGRIATVGQGLTLAGAGATVGLVIEDRWRVPGLHLEAATAIGRSPRVMTALDGSVAEVRPWTAKYVAMHMLGFGVRGKHRRWTAEASVMPGIAVTWMSASIARGDDATSATALLLTFSLRAELVGCRRLDPATRVCVVLAPSLYEHGFVNGGSLGLRWEVGP